MCLCTATRRASWPVSSKRSLSGAPAERAVGGGGGGGSDGEKEMKRRSDVATLTQRDSTTDNSTDVWTVHRRDGIPGDAYQPLLPLDLEHAPLCCWDDDTGCGEPGGSDKTMASRGTRGGMWNLERGTHTTLTRTTPTRCRAAMSRCLSRKQVGELGGGSGRKYGPRSTRWRVRENQSHASPAFTELEHQTRH